jgi:hypothetical protein
MAERQINQKRDRRGYGMRAPVAHALLPAADRARLERLGEFLLRQAERGAGHFEFFRVMAQSSLSSSARGSAKGAARPRRTEKVAALAQRLQDVSTKLTGFAARYVRRSHADPANRPAPPRAKGGAEAPTKRAT